MKYFTSTCAALIASASFSAAVERTTPKSEIKLGLEATTSWRNEYIYRGFQLDDSSAEFQLAGQLAFSDTETLDFGLYYGSSTGSGNFSETAGFIDFSKNIGDLTYTAKLALKDYSNSRFESGADLGFAVSWALNDSVELTSMLSYDTGADGFYFETKGSYFKGINDDSFLTLDAGASAVSDYYQMDGLHHAFAKLTYTYNISDAVSVSPYVAASFGLNSGLDDHLVGGVYFSVSF